MNRTVRTSVSLVALAVVLAGCSGSLTESKKIDYKSARQLPPLEIPPDLTAPTRDDRFAVPDVAPRGVATYSAYQIDRAAQPQASAAAAGVLPQVTSMRVERAGSQRWLVVPGAPEALWPQVKDFWHELGFDLKIERPEVGVMETEWAEDRAKIPQDFVRNTLGRVIDSVFSTPERDKFRTRLEAGKEPGTVEIYISHRGMQEIYPTEARDSTIWQPRPADPELEAEMLRRLMVRLGADEQRAQLALAPAAAPERATLNAAGGQTSLMLDESFDRAWRRVGLALDRIGFTVEDRDRSNGVYFVRYVDPEAEMGGKRSEGFLSKLAFWRRDAKTELGNGGEYRLRVKGEGDASVVSVLSREGGEASTDTARRILGLLQKELR